MHIKRLLQIVLAMVVAISLLFGWLINKSFTEYSQALNKATVSDQISVGVYQRRVLADDYLLNPTERAKQQWYVKQSVLQRLAEANARYFTSPAEKELLGRIRADLDSGAAIFGDVVKAGDNKLPGFNSLEQKSIFSGQLTVKTTETASVAAKLEDMNRTAAASSLHDLIARFIALLCSFFVLLLVIFGLVWRSALRLDRQEAEEAATLGSIGDGVFAIDNAGRIVEFNRASEVLTGYAKAEVLGRPYADVLTFTSEKTGLPADDFVKAALSGRPAQMPPDTQLTKRAGGFIPVADSAAPITTRQGKVAGAVVVFRDITKEREIDKTKSEFISLASHQLKTPPTALRWSTELLLDGTAGKLTKKQHEIVKDMATITTNMLEVVNALLNISRLELGTFTIDPRPVNMADLVRAVVKELHMPAEQKKQTIACEISDNLPTLPADPGLVKIIIENLVSNAVKYTPEGGTVRVMLRQEGQRLLLTVQDNGYGIPLAQRDKIFTKMFRADNIRDKIEGTGLGLYLLKTIVEDVAGGKVWFETAENSGTTFFVELPLSGMHPKQGTSRLT